MRKISRKPIRITSKRRFIIVAVAVILAVLLTVGILLYKNLKAQDELKVENIAISGSSSDTVEYQGKQYIYNNQIISILLIGVDSTGKMQSSSVYGEGGQADSIAMVILDRKSKRVKILPISRDTYTAVHSYTREGYDTGTIDTHLGFAYTFGDGGTASCKNTCLAVSDLLKGVPVHYYIAANIDSLAYANELAGGVTVTVPNDDVAHLHPELTTGARVTLTSDNVTDYLRYRDTNVNGSNNGRMARALSFYNGFVEKMTGLTEEDFNAIWKKLQEQNNNCNMLTSLNETAFMNIMSWTQEFSYDAGKDSLTIQGKDDLLNGRDIFYPDQEALQDLVINTFYSEKD